MTAVEADGLPDAAYAAALASLPGCGPARLMQLVTDGRGLEAVWHAVRAGRVAFPDAVIASWRSASARIDVGEAWSNLDAQNVRVAVYGRDGYPSVLYDDHEPPAVVFASSRVDLLDEDGGPRVAIVGTRRCTGYGADVARELGRELTRAGACVVSGLAAGIDGAAHEGALVAVRECDTDREAVPPPIAVVGSGLDIVYPRRHRRLWRDLIDHGLIVSEAPLGAAPEPWRFPLRNRIIAALADVVVVVESHAKGGSMHTVNAAIDRSTAVMAVPGSIHSPASAGTNQLLADGIPPVLGVEDVLVALSLDASAGRSPAGPRHQLDPAEERVLAAVDWSPTATEDILRRSGGDLGPTAAALARLEMAGMVRSNAGWWERVGKHR